MYLYLRMFAHIYTAALFSIVFSFVHTMSVSYIYDSMTYLYILYDIYIHIYRYLTNDILYVYILYILIPSKTTRFVALRPHENPKRGKLRSECRSCHLGREVHIFALKFARLIHLWGKENQRLFQHTFGTHP